MFAELLAYPQATESFLNPFCEEAGITIDFSLQENVWREAGRRLAKHANRRRAGKSLPSKRLLADYLVGAHALLQADRLLTLDPIRYKHDFPELHL